MQKGKTYSVKLVTIQNGTLLRDWVDLNLRKKPLDIFNQWENERERGTGIFETLTNEALILVDII